MSVGAGSLSLGAAPSTTGGIDSVRRAEFHLTVMSDSSGRPVRAARGNDDS
nr:hypothetical protein [Micromonospora provocatoris]